MQLKLDSGIIATFNKISINESQHCLWGISADGRYCAKIELGEWQSKENNLDGEARILKHLMDKGCMTSPPLLGHNTVETAEILPSLTKMSLTLSSKVGDVLTYIIVPAYTQLSGIYTPDVLMAIVEQKKLGVWHGDILAEHIYTDPRTNCIKLIDYDQAIMLDDEKINMPNHEYFDWLNIDAKERFGKYGKTLWHRDISNIKWDVHFAPFFHEDGAINLGNTFLFKSQETTMNESKIYHSFSTTDIYAEGERSLDSRREALDKIDFEPGETVLDVGCNAGLLTHYLRERGCQPWGIDIDPAVIAGAKLIANVMGKEGLEFECLDIDNGGPMGHFDTILMFSVIHHTKYIQDNAARISKFCKRIILECRRHESGAKPDGSSNWHGTTHWKHETVEDLIVGLEVLFPGFKHAKTHGQGDRDRYLFEFIKEA